MRAELIAVGSELVRFGRSDGNSLWLSQRLAGLGIEVGASHQVLDDPDAIGALLLGALERSRLVLLTGGLGPTEDDRTRTAVADALGLPLERDANQLRSLERWLAARGRRIGAAQSRQADLPRGSSWIPNRLGSAAGIWIPHASGSVCLLPGVPAEMRPMFDETVAIRLRGAGSGLAHRTLKVAGRVESSVDEQVKGLYATPGAEVTLLTGSEGLELKLRMRADDVDAAGERLDALDAALASRLGDDLYGRDDDTLAEVVGRLAVRLGTTVATAESCTAGLIAGRLTGAPGASNWFRGGLVVYDDELKRRLAHVREETLRAQGAVSEAVALELARGARERCAADVGIGVTGIAGPSGGSPDKPVGRVHLALAHAGGQQPWQLQFTGDRELIRQRTVTLALDRLRRYLMGQRTR